MMERIEDAAQPCIGNNFIPKHEPEFKHDICFEEKINNFEDDKVIKTEPDELDAGMCNSEDSEDVSVKLEAGDPEAAGRGVDVGLRGSFEEEETSPDLNGN